MKRSEAIAQIDDFIRFAILKEHQTHGEVVLSYLERLGMLPPAYDKFVEVPQPLHESGDPLYRKMPVSYQKFANDTGLHPTQKPVALLKYLIKTYTLEGETVLDFTMGSGSTGVACVNTGRQFIGIEQDDKYFTIAQQRIEQTPEELWS